MEKCLACLLVGERQCNDCRKTLCDVHAKNYYWEETDYTSDDSDGTLQFDVDLCSSCYDNRC